MDRAVFGGWFTADYRADIALMWLQGTRGLSITTAWAVSAARQRFLCDTQRGCLACVAWRIERWSLQVTQQTQSGLEASIMFRFSKGVAHHYQSISLNTQTYEEYGQNIFFFGYFTEDLSKNKWIKFKNGMSFDKKEWLLSQKKGELTLQSIKHPASCPKVDIYRNSFINDFAFRLIFKATCLMAPLQVLWCEDQSISA